MSTQHMTLYRAIKLGDKYISFKRRMHYKGHASTQHVETLGFKHTSEAFTR